jgi:hypothetical protein
MLQSQQLNQAINLDILPLDDLINILEGLDYKSLLAIRGVRQEDLHDPSLLSIDSSTDMYHPL